MARQGVTIKLDDGDRRRLEATIDAVASGVQSMDAFFDAAEMHMIESLTKNFEQGGRPRPWAPLSPVTVAMKGSDAILQDTGALKQSLNASNTERGNLSLSIWAGEKHGAFHQDPEEDPSKQWGMVNARGVPFRPFILFQDEDIDEIQKILGKWLDDVMRGV